MAKEVKKEKETKEKVEKETKPKSNKLVLFLAILAVIIVAAVVAGRFIYRRAKESVLGTFLSKTTGETVEVEEGGGKVTVTSEEGEFSFEEGGELPDNFPEDFPIYPGAKLTSSWTAQAEEKEGISLVWETSDSMEEVSEYYKEELASSGWKVGFSTEAEDTITMGFEKGDSSGFLGITTEEGKTIVSLTLGVE